MHFPTALAATLEDGGAVVVSNARAARALRLRYGASLHEKGLSAWRSPAILDWDSWLERLWMLRLRAGEESRRLLSPLQEHKIWVRLAAPSIQGLRLISIDGVADLAQEAYGLLCAYDGFEFLSGDFFGSPDCENFREWAQSFERERRKHGWISRGTLPLELAEGLKSAAESAVRDAMPKRLALLGFDRMTPAQQSLLDAWSAAGVEVVSMGMDREPRSLEAFVAAGDGRQEIEICAQWLRGILEESLGKKEKRRIAVIAPNQQERRCAIESIFRRILAPGSIPVSASNVNLPFEFSLGLPLDRTPLVQAALALLRWMREGLSPSEVTWLILSGFLWSEESDLLPLAQFDSDVRSKTLLTPEIELEAFLGHGIAASRAWSRSEASQGLRRRLRDARRIWDEDRARSLGFDDWAGRVTRILSAAGWPGGRRMSSEDFQLQSKWTRLLDSLATLSFEGPPVSYEELLRVLQREAHRTVFSPETRDAPVRILGPFESAGLEFDALWFMGADDASWPPPGHPHPFLPRAFQERHGMPHAFPGQDWELVKKVTDRVLASSGRLVVSYPARDKDGERRPSTVFSPMPIEISASELRSRLPADEAVSPGEEGICVEEERASGILWPMEQSPGGFDVLKMQAACPFQAFARVRLGAVETDVSELGLNAKERGILIHNLLQSIWEELRDWNSLVKADSEGRLRGIIERCALRAMDRFRNGEQSPWSAAYLAAERERVVLLIDEWLEYERSRAPFAVEDQEQAISIAVGDLKLRLRRDRIDKVEGGRLLIDYKTGRVKASDWDGERPAEPQLPLYAAYGAIPDLRGVLLAQVRAGEVKFDGRVQEPETTLFRSAGAGKKPAFAPPYSEEMRLQWQSALEALSRDFVNGVAIVDPRDNANTCKLCSLPSLCRVAETERLDKEDREMSAEEETGNSELAQEGEERSD